MSDVMQLREPDPINWEKYDTGGKKAFVMPPKGVYTVVETETPEQGQTRNTGHLQFTFPVLRIQAPGEAVDGATIRYTRANTQKWPNREGSGLGDYLKAHGVSGQQTNADYIGAVMAVTGRPFEVGIDWYGKCKQCGKEYKGMESFPVVDGNRNSWVDCPSGCQDTTDPQNPRPARIFANAEVKWFKSKE